MLEVLEKLVDVEAHIMKGFGKVLLDISIDALITTLKPLIISEPLVEVEVKDGDLEKYSLQWLNTHLIIMFKNNLKQYDVY